MRILFRLLLQVAPRPFRERFGPEILEQAEAETRRALRRGRAAGVWCAATTCADLLRTGLAERWWPTWPRTTDGGLETGGGGMKTMARWARDLRHGARTLRRTPGFAAAAVVTLSLALGAGAGIFGVMHAVVLRPLPFEEPDRLVHIGASAPGSDLPEEFSVSLEFFLQYAEQATRLDGLAATNSFTATVRAGDRAERLRQSMPTISLFRVLGVEPVIGRLPVPGEGGRVVLLSHGLWTTWFGADPGVLGQTHFFVDGPKEVIGVMPPTFRVPVDEVVAWIPVEYTAEDVAAPGRFGDFPLVGRLAPEADVASLARELDALADRLPELYGGSPRYAEIIRQHVPVVRPLRDEMLGEVRTPLAILAAAVALLLLVACANVAGLFTARAEARGRDLAVRRAVGAGRRDLVRAILAEVVVVAVAAGLGAIALAWVALPAFASVAPAGLPRAADIGMTPAVALFTLAAALASALVCGLGPALRFSTPPLERLRDAARGTTRGRPWGRDALVVVQTALALVLLTGSGLLLRSFRELRAVDPGYDRADILTFQFAPEEAHLVDGPSWARFHVDFMNRLRSIPGIETVGIVENVPLEEGLRDLMLISDEAAAGGPEAGQLGSLTFAAGDYFRAMGIEVLEGRAFTDADALVPGQAVVSRAAADRLWPGRSAIGRQLRTDVLTSWHTVIGVVEDVRQYELGGPPEPVVYLPPVGPEPDSWSLPSPGYVLRGPRAEEAVAEVRALVREVSPSAPVYRVYTMAELVDRSMIDVSFMMLTLGVAAGLALVLGAVGLYGILSYLVAQRTQEIGVRMALGAPGARVLRGVIGGGLALAGVGVGLGLVGSLAASRLLASMLYGVSPHDPVTYGATACLLAAVALVASWIPARRAARVDPVRALRAD